MSLGPIDSQSEVSRMQAWSINEIGASQLLLISFLHVSLQRSCEAVRDMSSNPRGELSFQTAVNYADLRIRNLTGKHASDPSVVNAGSIERAKLRDLRLRKQELEHESMAVLAVISRYPDVTSV
ncbi:hypothetical protein PsYK624_081350 [Phanerochaete sordida]|uniref:Uncharacterized protein n=1 Tax=Phanerochaete sordida TaxID=48140 RepID=A0A9P3GC95_9APHY|nr:hypothetical protein PsYK624_081350 [Phanerochaete sordida]